MIAWIIAGVAAAGAAAIFLRLQAAARRIEAGREEIDALQEELQSGRAQLEKASAKARRAGEDVVDLRKKLEKAKRRATQGAGAGGAKGASLTRVQALEAELEQARQARDAAREEAAGLGAELSRVRAAMSSSDAVKPLLDNAAITALQQRSEADRARVESLSADLARSERAREKLKGKSRTQDYLYASMRAELDAKKDRLRQQQEELERLRAFKVAVVDPLPQVAEAPETSDGPAGAVAEVEPEVVAETTTAGEVARPGAAE